MTESSTSTNTFNNLSKNDFISLIYDRYGKKLYSYAQRKWHLNEDETWELIYKTLYKVSDRFSQLTFESEEKFAAFIFTVFMNYLRNHYRDKKKESEQITSSATRERETEKQTGVLSLVSQPVLLQALKEELEKMEDWQRILLLMRSNGSSYAEIALYVNKPEHQLKVYYQRLKELISKKLHDKS